MTTATWTQWKNAVVELIRDDYNELFPQVQLDDIDWDAWHPLFAQGCSPAAAVSSALSPTQSARISTDQAA